MEQQEDKRLFLLDAYALIFRAYYAFIKNPRYNSQGVNTSAVLGFLNTILEIIKKEKPTHLAVAFDVGGETVRHTEYAEYKANRDETPEGIKVAVPYIHKILQAMHIPILTQQGYEADDIIGTLAKKAEKEGYTTYMVTSDKDFAQLVSDNIFMYKPSSRGNDIEIWGIPEVQKKFDIQDPLQIIDYLGMMGDSVDNIPGIPGIGPKTASKFLSDYGSMEGLYENVEDLTGKQKENVANNKEIAFLSKKLARIITDVPIEFDPNTLTLDEPDIEKIQELFNELEFRRLLDNFYKTYGIQSESADNQTTQTPSVSQDTGGIQMSLFDSVSENKPEDVSYQNAENTNHLYQHIDSIFALDLLLKKILQQQAVCFDTETTSLDTLEAQWLGISFSYEPHKAYYISIPQEKSEQQAYIEKLKTFFENHSIIKIAQNIKFDYKILKKYGIDIEPPFFDTMIAHYLLSPDGRHGMDVLSEVYLNYKPISLTSLIGKKGKNQGNFSDLSQEVQTEYAAEDADITYQLYETFSPKFQSEVEQKLLYDLELPLTIVLGDMENEGICIDTKALQEMSKTLEIDLTQLEKNIFEKSGEEFNLNSPKQMGDILFGKLQLEAKPKKTKSGQYATSEDILQKLAHKHEIINEILEYRQLQKLKSTYVDALPKSIHPQTGRIHTTFTQTVAATGRLASNNPNLQNIPIKTERGREVRKAFVAQDDNHVLVSADYSQIELRLIAELSGDPVMTQAFIRGEDIHASTASRVFNVALNKVTREQRSQAKTVNFGIIYGVSAFGLSEQAQISRTEAKELIDAYYKTYPRLKEYMNEQVEKARKDGFVETVLGRRRYLPEIHSANAIVRGHAERNAVNAPIQGSAADIIKLAMIQIHHTLKSSDYKTKMLLQVHDELVFEVPKEELEDITQLLKDKMENALPTQIPLVVDIGVGNNWLEAH